MFESISSVAAGFSLLAANVSMPDIAGPWYSSPDAWAALLTLTLLEIVLGIDNIVFISILVDRLPLEQRKKARFIGLGLAMVMRLLLLVTLKWIMGLVAPLFQIPIFSLDSVITAVGMAKDLTVMALAVIISVGVMMVSSGAISDFVSKHPSVKMLALSFLILIGTALMAEGLHFHIPKGYIYFAMAFSLGVEMLNLKLRSKGSPAQRIVGDSGT